MAEFTRTTIEWKLRLLSTMHIGTGAAVKSVSQSDVALTAISSENKACIPGTTLKGVLRSQCQTHVDRLFGVPHGSDSNHAAGAVAVFCAYGDRAPEAPSCCSQQTAVDRGTGGSKANALFQRQIVSIGTIFSARAVIKSQTDHRELVEAFLGALAEFGSADGVNVGRSQSDNCGLLKLIWPVNVQTEKLGPSGWQNVTTCRLNQEAGEASSEYSMPNPRLRPPSQYRFQFRCAGPYHVFGETKEVYGQKIDKPLRRKQGNKYHPALQESGISGALRTRAEWLAHRLGQTDVDADGRSIVERLFGMESWRGSLNLRVSDVECGEPAQLPMVSIDRFSQAGLDGALFKLEADINTRFTLNIFLFRDLLPAETEFLEALAADLRRSGLRLGKKTTSGFGWFAIEKVSADEEKKSILEHAGTNNAKHPKYDQLVTLEKKQSGKANAFYAHFLGVEPDEVDAIRESGPLAQAPSNQPHASVTLPYRHIFHDNEKVGFPEPSVQSALAVGKPGDITLHSHPLPGSLCGSVDVSWVFIRPMLVSDGTGSAIRIGGRPVLPGTSIKGNIRSILEAATASRLDRISTSNVEHFDINQWEANIGGDRYFKGSHANPDHFDEHGPDFVQALFGFVREPAPGSKHGPDHPKHHLKSRLSFGMGWLQGELPAEREQAQVIAGGPNPSSRLYNQLGWKRYPIDHDAPEGTSTFVDEFITRQAPKARATESQIARFTLLDASRQAPISFRERIYFHNVTSAELGALLWAITWELSPDRFHKMGYAKPFGAGVCRAQDIVLSVDRDVAHVEGPQPFNAKGAAMAPFVEAFKEYLSSQGLLGSRCYQELLASATPGTIDDPSGYQTWQQIKDKAGEIKHVNGGRITAMQRP